MSFQAMKKNQEWSFLLLRVVVGCVFLAHGYMKWSMFDTASPIFKILAIAEPLGGIALILGLLTPWAALGLAIIMLGAMQMKIGNGGITGFASSGGWEFDALLFSACIVLMSVRAGKYSLDHHAGWDK